MRRRRNKRLTLCAGFTSECICVDVVDERPLSVDLHYRQPFAIRSLELVHARDVDLRVVEAELVAQLAQPLLRALAERASLCAVETDVGQGYRPRVTVASATRCTARP